MREFALNNTPVASTLEKNKWLQNLSRCSDRHGKRGTLRIVRGLPHMNGPPSDNFERFSRIVCEGDWGLIHIQYEILVSPRLINHFWACNIYDVV
jgi:hypothetical protein